MTTYQIVKKELKRKRLSKEEAAKLESLKDLQKTEKLAKSVTLTLSTNPLITA